jgi:cyclopropane fatty-acyl-phospholipid synthase-like methyltransferase
MHEWASGYGGTIESPKEDISRRLEAINSLASQNEITSILDFGSGEGEMVSALSQYFEVFGLEPEDEARERCLRKNMGVFNSIEAIQKNNSTFDLITLFHVVEHFYSPSIEFKAIYNLLNPGGYLIVETPNSQDVLLTEYQCEAFSNFTYWSHHPMLHSASSLSKLVADAGFDSVYVQNIQRYGLANHLYWLARQEPGGHVHWKNRISQLTEESYSKDLISEGKSDTLWLTARKPFESTRRSS